MRLHLVEDDAMIGEAVVGLLRARDDAVDRVQPLLVRPGMLLSRAQLEEKLDGWNDDASSNAIESASTAFARSWART